MRCVIYGAGAIGGALAGRLALAGCDVLVIARGANLEALRRRGLRIATPQGSNQVPVEAVGSPADVAFTGDDVVILATKSQDTESVLASLEAATDGRADVPVVCAQNGVDNERMVGRRGFTTYGMCVTVPAVHLEPGVIELRFGPVAGLLDLGRHPSGADRLAEQTAATLTTAGFAARARPDVMRWKYAKLLGNVEGALEAIAGPAARGTALGQEARAEALACYAAAGIEYASAEEMSQAFAALAGSTGAAAPSGAGGSSWQSLQRATGRIEADWLNGEIVLLGALHGVRTPVNNALRRLANRMARERTAPGSVPLAQVERLIAR